MLFLELLLGISALSGGLLLIVQPNGSLLQAKLSAPRGTPFMDWRVPGVFLAGCIGGGSLLSAFWLWRRLPCARELALLTAVGVVAFEAVEWAMIGFQILEAFVALVAGLMLLLAWRLPAARLGQRRAR